MAREKELPGVEVDRDQRFLMQGLRNWTLGILAVGGFILAVIVVASWIWPSDSNKLSPIAQRSYTTTECPGKMEIITLTETPVDVSKDGKCLFMYSNYNMDKLILVDDKGEHRAEEGLILLPERNRLWAKATVPMTTIHGVFCPLWLKGIRDLGCTPIQQTAQTR
ncbi:MAG: hypothetical protein Q7S26_00415 [bacterium]|nr:hypothetical protein [bacterium]